MNTQEYFDRLKDSISKEFEIAAKAKAVGIDPISKVEIPIATTLAEKTVGLISVVYPQLDEKIVSF